jgi:hypothetical protein
MRFCIGAHACVLLFLHGQRRVGTMNRRHSPVRENLTRCELNDRIECHQIENTPGGAVNYRGVEYKVVQTIVGGFRWSVQFGKQEKSGLLPRRNSAIMHIKNLIDGRAERDRRLTTPQVEVAAVAARSSAQRRF